MATDFIGRQVDRLLDEAAETIGRADWDTVRQPVGSTLRLDPENADALALLTARGGPRTHHKRSPGHGQARRDSCFARGWQ